MKQTLRLRGGLCPNFLPIIHLFYTIFLTLTIVLVSCVCSIAQVSAFSPEAGPAAGAEKKAIDVTASGIQIGQEVPDVTITNIHNYKTETAKVSDFKGKLLVLDFWATWCGPCVAMIPKMDSLQKEFGDKVQFLSVTYQKAEVALPFLEKFEKQRAKQYDLPVVTGDKLLKGLFPHKMLPHYVWINGDGVVEGVTGYAEVNQENIQKALEGNAPKKQKKDIALAYDKNKPISSYTSQENVLYRSSITGYIEGLTAGYEFTPKPVNGNFKLISRNQSLARLYALAYADKDYITLNRIIMEVREPTKLHKRITSEDSLKKWQKAGNVFCYDLKIPFSLKDSAFAILRKDLDVFFPQYKVSFEEREVRCWALIRTSNNDKLKTKGGERLSKYDRFGCRMRNFILQRLITELNSYYQQLSPIPIINVTNYKGRVDMELKADLTDMESINKALKAYDLKFVKEDRVIKMIVIKDAI